MLELYANRRTRAVGSSSGRSIPGQNVPFSSVHILRACSESPFGLRPWTKTTLHKSGILLNLMSKFSEIYSRSGSESRGVTITSMYSIELT